MPSYAGIKFINGTKVYHFLSGELCVKNGDYVIVETTHGLEFGQAVTGVLEFDENSEIKPSKSIIRIATAADIKQNEINIKKEAEAFALCEQKIASHKLVMKLVEVSYTFDSNKIIFFFTADGRVDFRDLVKDLASTFKTRIELRQIGVRDEAKMLGGFGLCGKTFCCSTFMNDFVPVSIKMAKEQGLSMNPSKISGACGRLMCCLKYEQPAYDELSKITPKQGSIVNTPDGAGLVLDASLISGNLSVRLDKNREGTPRTFHRSQVKLIKAPQNHDEAVPKELKELE